MRHATSLVVLGALLTAPSMAAAQAAERVSLGSPECRVRAFDREAQRLLSAAAAASLTVARLIADLQVTDVLVTVELKTLPKRINGHVQVAAATPVLRYPRLTLRVPNDELELIAVLGHELRHVTEIALMPDVRDDNSLARAYRRIGTAGPSDGYFETEAALETGRAVARELRAARGVATATIAMR